MNFTIRSACLQIVNIGFVPSALPSSKLRLNGLFSTMEIYNPGEFYTSVGYTVVR